MEKELVNSNVVILAEQFNPSILSQIWLVKNDIFAEGDFKAGFVFTEAITQVSTSECELLVVPPRAQFTLKCANDAQQELIVSKIGRLVNALPETPYRAVGFNLQWHLVPDDATVEELTRRLFFVNDNPVHEAFDAPDARFGSYLSKDSMGFRLKLSIQPVIVQRYEEPGQHAIAFSFNYHCPLDRDPNQVSKIQDLLSRWDDALRESTQILDTLTD
ncbi:MAG: hypothetical protein R3E01_13420 [Pirellulaceae bacterium]